MAVVACSDAGADADVDVDAGAGVGVDVRLVALVVIVTCVESLAAILTARPVEPATTVKLPSLCMGMR